MAPAKGFAEQALCDLGVSSCAQHEVDGVPLGIDGTVQVAPLLLDLDLGLTDAVGVVCRVQQHAVGARTH